jgi:hypothetical protein
LFSDVFSSDIPAYTTLQNWILQYGVHELSKPIQKRNDWIFILDHTIEFSTQKCLLVLGISMEKFMSNKCIICHEDVYILRLSITVKTDGIQIFNLLDTIVKEVGIPKQIISDHGSDIMKGVRLLCGKYQNIVNSYDITHKCAILLKHILGWDIKWNQFVRNIQETKRKILNTDLAFLAPPKPREKSRWLNLDRYVDWAEKVLVYTENSKNNNDLTKNDKKELMKKLEKYFSWITTYKDRMLEWRQILTVLTVAKCEVKHNGLQQKTLYRFQNKINDIQIDYPRVKSLIAELECFLYNETSTIPSTENWLGTSDIIESIFGKYKNFSARTAMKGIGKTILTIPVFTSTITVEKIKIALESVSIHKLNKWLIENVGESLFAKRKNAFNNN